MKIEGKKTSIQVHESTIKKLEDICRKNETYEELILKMISYYKK